MKRVAKAAFAVAVLACASPASAADDKVSITWTSHGIPHIVASNFGGLGYGFAYATAQLDVCGMADMFATFSGERARDIGADGSDLIRLLGRRPIKNQVSDFSRRLIADDDHVSAAKAALSPQLHSLISGYAAGFNAYIAKTPLDRLPAQCRKAGMVNPISEDDVIRRIAGVATLLSSGLVLQELYDAAPPTGGGAILAVSDTPTERLMAGSNAYAFGRTLTGGAGLLLGNPHFFWDGPDRFIEAHLTVRGQYDVMGASLLGMPLITIGFNRSLAWSHTVATDARGAVYKLRLDPIDPTRYLIDGRSVPMTHQDVTILSRDGSGQITPQAHRFWITQFGPVLESAALPWTHEVAYALADADRDNFRVLKQWLEIGESRDVKALKNRLDGVEGLPWVNTVAADSRGDALYADISVAPNLSGDALKACAADAKFALSGYLAMLDGSRSACMWTRTPGAAQVGVLPSWKRPSLIRSDYVENSNGSYWLVNPAHPLEGFSPIIGHERAALNFRTRQGDLQISDYVRNPAKRINATDVEQILFSSRSLQAELTVPAILRACEQTSSVALKDGSQQDLRQPCMILSRWDRRYDLGSVGAPLFTAFVGQAKLPGTEDLSQTPALWSTAFDPADPLNTPRDLKADGVVLKALGQAARNLETAHIPLDAPLRDVQFVERNGVRIPLHGGATFSAVAATLKPNMGFTDPLNPSNSYIQVVGFTRRGPVADALLVSSQSPDPKSPYYADQTTLYAQKRWIRLPFEAAAVAAEATAAATVLHFASPH